MSGGSTPSSNRPGGRLAAWLLRITCPAVVFGYLAWQAVASGLRRFTASVSFGLLLLCIGLFLTCVYLLRY